MDSAKLYSAYKYLNLSLPNSNATMFVIHWICITISRNTYISLDEFPNIVIDRSEAAEFKLNNLPESYLHIVALLSSIIVNHYPCHIIAFSYYHRQSKPMTLGLQLENIKYAYSKSYLLGKKWMSYANFSKYYAECTIRWHAKWRHIFSIWSQWKPGYNLLLKFKLIY